MLLKIPLELLLSIIELLECKDIVRLSIVCIDLNVFIKNLCAVPLSIYDIIQLNNISKLRILWGHILKITFNRILLKPQDNQNFIQNLYGVEVINSFSVDPFNFTGLKWGREISELFDVVINGVNIDFGELETIEYYPSVKLSYNGKLSKSIKKIADSYYKRTRKASDCVGMVVIDLKDITLLSNELDNPNYFIFSYKRMFKHKEFTIVPQYLSFSHTIAI